MLYSQKYCLVSFSSQIDVGIEFEMNDWPLHVTLADAFAIDLGNNIEKRLSELLIKQPLVTTSVGKEVVLGETKVVLIDRNDWLLELHNHMIDLLESEDAKFNNPEFT